MDILKCFSLAAVETFAVARYLGWLINTQVGCILFFAQYLALKYYRIFLYHKYFSPLRHLPGPAVSYYFLSSSTVEGPLDCQLN